MRIDDRAVPTVVPHTPTPGTPWANWPAQLRVAVEILDQPAYTYDEPAIIIPGPAADLLEPFNDFTTNFWQLTGTPTIVVGRTGTAANISGSSARADWPLAAAESDYVTIGFAWRTTSGTALRNLAVLASDTNTITHTRLRFNGSTNELTVCRDTVILGTSAAGLIANDTWYYLELQARLHDTLGAATLRLNGAPIITLTNVDTRLGGTKTVYDTLRLGAAVGSSGTALFDDLYVSTGADAVFLGDITIP